MEWDRGERVLSDTRLLHQMGIKNGRVSREEEEGTDRQMKMASASRSETMELDMEGEILHLGARRVWDPRAIN